MFHILSGLIFRRPRSRPRMNMSPSVSKKHLCTSSDQRAWPPNPPLSSSHYPLPPLNRPRPTPAPTKEGGGGRWIDPCRGDSAACFPLVAAASDAPSCMEKVPLPPRGLTHNSDARRGKRRRARVWCPPLSTRGGCVVDAPQNVAPKVTRSFFFSLEKNIRIKGSILGRRWSGSVCQGASP